MLSAEAQAKFQSNNLDDSGYFSLQVCLECECKLSNIALLGYDGCVEKFVGDFARSVRQPKYR